MFKASLGWAEQSSSPSACNGIYFSELDCGYGDTYSFPESECIKANITVAENDASNYLSAMASCSVESGCTWSCYSDKNCSSEPTVYTGYSCDCAYLNNRVNTNINGSTMLSSQGYDFGNVCSDITFYFEDCVDRVFTTCYANDPSNMQATGICTNSNTLERCKFSASNSGDLFSESINCPSCNATGDGYFGNPGATCTDNVICFDTCQSTQCLRHMNNSQHYFYGCDVKNYKTCKSDLYYDTVHTTGTCLNPKTGKPCDFSLDYNMNIMNYYTTVCSSCSANVSIYPRTPDINNFTGCSPVSCLPDCQGNEESHKNLIIIGSSVGGGVLLLAAAVTSAALIIYKCINRSGYQRIND